MKIQNISKPHTYIIPYMSVVIVLTHKHNYYKEDVFLLDK